MPWIKNSETLINTTSMHPLVLTQMTAAPLLLAIICICLIALIRLLAGNVCLTKFRWAEFLNRNWNDTDVSVPPIYRKVIAGGLRIWVFSGDVDSVVPVTATRYSLAQLKLTTKVPWYPWYVKKQVGGWTEVYEGLTFATVRGAGHEVPLFKPRAALQLFKSFLRGDPLPKS